MANKLFGTAGIRGPIENKVTPEMAHKLAFSLGTYTDGGKIVVGKDTRTSSDMLEHAIISGLLSSGSDVVDIGLAPTPCLAFSTKNLGADSGIMITASHNPAPDNGIKFHNPDGMEYLPEQELDIEEIFFEKKFKKANWDDIGELNHYTDGIRNYTNNILNKVEVEPKYKVVLDCASGAPSTVTPYLLRELDCEVTTINSNPDGRFPGRSPEPQPWNLKDLKMFLGKTDADVGFAHDGDGDRITVFDEDGKFVQHDTLIALFAREAVKKHGGGTVITSINTSASIEEVVKKEGGKVMRVPLGNLHATLDDYDTVYAGEPSKSLFPDYNRWTDGIYAASKLLEVMSSKSEPLSELTAEIPSYPMHRENFPCPDEKKKEFMEKIRDHLLENVTEVRDTDEVDGLRITKEDGSWILIRTSGTEPKVRMVLEGKTEEDVKKLRKIGLKGIKKILE